MAKRFTDTNKYKKPFIRGLKGAYKLLWDYLYHDCDHAGIWIVDFDIAQIYIGFDMQVEKNEALKLFNNDECRIIEIDNGTKWFIPSFINFQYGELNEKNRAHNSVIQILNKNNLLKENKPLTSPLKGAKDKDKDMVKDKDKDKESLFNDFWGKYHTTTNQPKTDREPALKYWNKLPVEEMQKAINNISLYYTSLPDSGKGKFPKKARTYLSDKNYNDEYDLNHSLASKEQIHLSQNALTYLSMGMQNKISNGDITEKEAFKIEYPDND